MSDVPDPFYPAWRFHPTLPAKIVTAAEDAVLDADWVNDPAKLLPGYAPAAPEGPAPAPAPLPAEPPPLAAEVPEPAPAPKKSHHKKKEID